MFQIWGSIGKSFDWTSRIRTKLSTQKSTIGLVDISNNFWFIEGRIHFVDGLKNQRIGGGVYKLAVFCLFLGWGQLGDICLKIAKYNQFYPALQLFLFEGGKFLLTTCLGWIKIIPAQTGNETMKMYTNCKIDLPVDSWPSKRKDMQLLIN